MPRTLSADEYKELGKRHYGRKDYQKALDAFTEAIDATVRDDVQLYDYRAATFEKLDDLKSALADSRRAIKAGERDPRGYLRAAQTLQRMEKQEQASLIYQRGLRYVPASHPQIKLLHAAFDKLTRELAPTKAVDPLSQLPVEIVEMIISQLKFYQLVGCLRVSKQWRTFLTSIPSLWTELDLFKPGNRRNVVHEFVQNCIKWSGGQILSARITNFGHRQTLNRLATVCKSLHTIEFLNGPFGKDSIFQTAVSARTLRSLTVHEPFQMSLDTVALILRHRPSLVAIKIFGLNGREDNPETLQATFPNLQVLELHFQKGPHDRFTDVVAPFIINNGQCWPNLKELRIQQTWRREDPFFPMHIPRATFRYWPKLEVIVARGFFFIGTGRVALTLKTIEFDIRAYVGAANDTLDVTFDNGFPALQDLSLRGWRSAIDPMLDASRGNDEAEIKPPGSMLRRIHLDMKRTLELDEVLNVLNHIRLKEVEDVAILGLGATEIDDDIVPNIVNLKQLRKLSLDSAMITGIGVKMLCTGLKNLETLTLNNCDKVSHDAVRWAANQGINVKVNDTGLKAGSGRRI